MKITDFEKHPKAYYEFQYYNPKDPKCDELGYVHFENQIEKDDHIYINDDANYRKSLAMPELEHGIFLAGCFVTVSIIILAMVGVIMYVTS